MMKTNLFLIFIICIGFSLINTISSQDINGCIEAVQNTDTDEEMLDILKKNPWIYTENHEECIDILLKTGNFESAKYFMDQLIINKVKFRDALKKTVNNIEINMKELYNKYRFEEEDFQTVSPVIQWAQSMDHIYINVKFSHRHDTPGCQEVKNLNVDILQDRLFLQCFCIQSEIPIKFQLNLPYFVDVAPEESSHKHESNGRYHFKLGKSQTGMYWDRLTKTPDPKYSKVWIEMQEKFKQDINKFVEDDEDAEFDKIVEDMNKKKKKKRKKKVKFDK